MLAEIRDHHRRVIGKPRCDYELAAQGLDIRRRALLRARFGGYPPARTETRLSALGPFHGSGCVLLNSKLHAATS